MGKPYLSQSNARAVFGHNSPIEKIGLNAFKAYLPQKFPRSPPFLFAFRFFNGLSSAYAQSNA